MTVMLCTNRRAEGPLPLAVVPNLASCRREFRAIHGREANVTTPPSGGVDGEVRLVSATIGNAIGAREGCEARRWCCSLTTLYSVGGGFSHFPAAQCPRDLGPVSNARASECYRRRGGAAIQSLAS